MKPYLPFPSHLSSSPRLQVRVASYMRHMTREDTEGSFQVGPGRRRLLLRLLHADAAT